MTASSARQLALEANAVDAALMARVRQRDPAAVRDLFDRHSTLVHALGLRILGDEASAEELVRDVFLHLWHHAQLFDAERGQFVGWLVSLTRNRAVDRVRVKRVRDRIGGDLEPEVVPPPPPRRTDPHESPYATELRAAVADALAGLPAPEREALELGYFGGWNYDEMSERLATTRGTVKARIRLGMARMHELLGEFAESGLATEVEE